MPVSQKQVTSRYNGEIFASNAARLSRNVNGIAYMNDGDWVESCTALVEHHDGRWEILHMQPHGVHQHNKASLKEGLLEF